MQNSKKVLVVEDENDVAKYLTILLEDNGFITIRASNGLEGLAKAKKEKPDLITLDISMPEESGILMYEKMSNDPDTKEIPVVVVTGVDHVFKEFLANRKETGPPLAYFDKPIDEEQFLQQVKEIVDF